MLFKRTSIPLVVIMVSVAIFAAGCFNKSAKDTNAVPANIGIIDMAKAVQAHPRYNEFLSQKQELNTLVAQGQAQARQQAAVAATPQLSASSIQDSAALNAALEQEFKEKMTAKQSELHQKLSVKAEALRQQLTDQMNAYTAELDKEYQPQIFNLQLKLKTVQLKKEEMEALQTEIEKLQQTRHEMLTLKEKQLAEQMDAAMAPEQAAVEQQLADFSKQLNSQLAEKAAVKGAEISSRNQAGISALTTSTADNGLRELEQKAGLKRQEIAALEQTIIQDVRDKAAKVAAERQLDSVITNVQVNITAVDITEAVIAEFKK